MDAAPGADGPSVCSPNPIAVPFDDPRWVVAGDATKGNATVILTPKTPFKKGAVEWRDKHAFDAFEMEVELRIAASTTPGDGLAFAWLDVGSVPAVGGDGGNMGVCGLAGYAVALDTTVGPDAGGAVSIKLVDLQKAPPACSDSPIAEKTLAVAVIGSSFHRLRVSLAAGGHVVAAVDGSPVLDATIPDYQAFSGYFAFAAATGGAFSEHTVRAPTIAVPNEASCP